MPRSSTTTPVPTVGIGTKTYDSRPLSPEVLAAQDCVVLVTDHDEIPLETVVSHALLLFDTRNATVGIDADHVHRL